MSSLKEIISLGKEIGLDGVELREFVANEQERLSQLEREEKQREREERAAEREIRKQQLEVERLRLQVQGGGTTRPSDVDVCKPSLPKLPVFNDATDSTDAYVLRFERLSTSAG